jgi:hypothetical protein
MSRILGVPTVMFSQIMARAGANSVPEWLVRVVLVMLKAPNWHFRPSQEFVEFGREYRSNLGAVLGFLRDFLAYESYICSPWEEGKNPTFSDEGAAQIKSMALNIGAMASILRMLRQEGLLKSLQTERTLVSEAQILYAVLPTILGPSSWPKCVGMTDEENQVFVAAGEENLRWGAKVEGVIDYLGLHERTTVLHGNGIVINLNLDASSTVALIATQWNDIPWVEIFPSIRIVAEAPVPEKVLVVAKTAAPAEKPKAEVLPQLPEVPVFIQGPTRTALEALACSAVGGPNDEMGYYFEAAKAAREAQAKVGFINEEIRRLQLELGLAQGTAKTMADAEKAAKADLDASFPARQTAHRKFLAGLQAATQAHNANVALQAVLGIEVDATSAELA